MKHDFSEPILVVCPHFDDACFSVGGLLLKERFQAVTLLTVFSKSRHAPNFRLVNYLLKTAGMFRSHFLARKVSDWISKKRKNEDAQFCRHVGATQDTLAFNDSSLRGCTVSYVDGKDFEEDSIYRDVYAALDRYIASNNFNSIFCPLGVGNQIDHLIILNALLRIYQEKDSFNLFFYEDLPYAYAYSPNHIKSVAFEKIKTDDCLCIDVTDEMPFKLNLVDIYRSQSTPREKKQLLFHAARLYGVNEGEERNAKGYCERYWKVRKGMQKTIINNTSSLIKLRC